MIHKLRNSNSVVDSLVRRKRQTLTVGWLAAVSLVLVVYAYYGLHRDFWVALALSLGTNLLIVIATYLIFNPLVEQVRTATTHEHHRLDFDAFIEHVASSRGIICVLTTWTNLLEDPYRQRFLSAMKSALNRNVVVKILLLDPQSRAAEMRSEELRWREDVSGSIMANLRTLDQFRGQDINEQLRLHLEVRIYAASPSVMFYRWDNRAYLSFFAIGRLAEYTPKLETFVTTPWADFVRLRFEELWNDPTTVNIEQYLRVPLVVHDRLGMSAEFDVEYVTLEDVYYVASSPLIRFVLRHGIDNLTAKFNGPPHGSTNIIEMEYTFRMLEDWGGLGQSILEFFQSKYGHGPTEFLCLVSEAGDK